MFSYFIQSLLILLLIFTPLALGSVEIWAFSLMEMGILLIIIFWALDSAIRNPHSAIPHVSTLKDVSSLQFAIRNPQFAMIILFLCLVLLQMVPLPSGLVRFISPRSYELRHSLSISSPAFELSAFSFELSVFPFATKIEFFKWLTLTGLFIFLLQWEGWKGERRTRSGFMLAIFLVGVLESLYGMFEFFSGHNQIFHLKGLVSSVTGTFINRNYFAGYLLMVIPLSTGFLFSRDFFQRSQFRSWRYRLSSLDGKTLLVGFGIILMILGLLFSASRMGIASLLFSFGAISLFLKDPGKKGRFSKKPVLILVLALLWGAWIGLDAVMNRFLASSEDFKSRWEMWGDTSRIIEEFPVFGSGLGTFVQVYPMYDSSYKPGIATHAENDFLQLASEVGVIGIGLLLILFLILFYKAIFGIRLLSHGESERNIGIGGLVGIMALMLHSLVERNIQVPANAFLYTFIFATVLRIASSPTSAHHPGEKGGDLE